MHGQARERETGDVDLLDRAQRVLQPVERRFGDELESGGAKLLEQGAQRDAFARRVLLEIRERERRHRGAIGHDRHFPDASDGGSSTRRDAGNPQLSRGGRVRNRRADIGGKIGDAHERGPRAVALPAEIVGHHAEADDVVGSGEGRQLGFGHEWSTVSV